MSITLITGASSGIGRGLALRMAAAGETVVVMARRQALLDTLVDEIRAAGGRAVAVAADVTRPDEVMAAVSHVEARLGAIDRLVANAGGGRPVDARRFTAGPVDEALRLNVLGVAHCVEAVLPAMLERRSGHLVVTSSLAGYRGLPSAAAYGAAKAGVTHMMESLRIELHDSGIDVTVILPGFVRTKARKKGKAKPFSIEADDAARRMQQAIERRAAYVAFPASLRLAVAIARVLPAGLYDRLVRSIAR